MDEGKDIPERCTGKGKIVGAKIVSVIAETMSNLYKILSN
jgi:hypothetical protein